jgi:membrane-associated phospholipid phosphatase
MRCRGKDCQLRLCDDRLMRVRIAIRVGALVAFVVLTVLVATRWAPLVRLDLAVSAWARRVGRAHPVWVDAWRVVTHVGDTLPLLVLGVAAVLLLVASLRPIDAAAIVVVSGAAQLIALAVRLAIARDRPVDPFTPVSSYAFPSGHTLHSMVAAVLAVYLVQDHPQRRAVAWLLGSVAVLIGVSRVMLLAHWPTDVLGGWLLAFGVASVLLAGADRRQRSGVAATAIGPPPSAPPPSALLRGSSGLNGRRRPLLPPK